jgi:chromosome segregation ATPase
MRHGDNDEREPRSNENLRRQVQDINTWGAELVRSMEELRMRLHERADELASVRRTLATRQHELALEAERLDQQRAPSNSAPTSTRPETGAGRTDGQGQAILSSLASEREALANERLRLDQLANGLDEDRRQLEAERADLEAARSALNNERAELARATEAAAASESERESAWNERLAELQEAREAIASLQSRLEYERRMAAQRSRRAEGEVPATSTPTEKIGQLQRLSRDARRRARGS